MILHTLAKSPGSSDRSLHELACRGLKDSISLCYRLFLPTISCAKKAFYLLPYKPLHYHKLQSVHTNITLHIFIKPQIRSVPSSRESAVFPLSAVTLFLVSSTYVDVSWQCDSFHCNPHLLKLQLSVS